MRIVFTSSSAIDIVSSSYDLSRRVTLITLPGLSFREFLTFSDFTTFGEIDIESLLKDPQELNKEVLKEIEKPLFMFTEYLNYGYYPIFRKFSKKSEMFEAVSNSTKKTIYEDIGTIKRYRSTSLVLIEKILNYLINTSAGELSISSLSKLIEKDFSTTSSYLKALQEAGLIIGLHYKRTGKKFLRNPEKAYPANTTLMTSKNIPMLSGDRIGKFREVFAVSHLNSSSHNTTLTNAGDFLVDDKFTLEIGGSSKNFKQISTKDNSFVLADNTIAVTNNGHKIPLYLLGFLY
jgi:hypothetical protein